MAEGFWLNPVSFPCVSVQIDFCTRQRHNEINSSCIKILWEGNGTCLYSDPLKKNSMCLYFRKTSHLLFLFIWNLRLFHRFFIQIKIQPRKVKHKWIRYSDTQLQLRGQWKWNRGLGKRVRLGRPPRSSQSLENIKTNQLQKKSDL